MRRLDSRGPLEPPGHSVHVWLVRLEASAGCLAQAHASLSGDETARAARFRFEQNRREFVLGRAALRLLAGRYLNRAPADVAFSYGPRGKPALVDPGRPLHFNVSNSRDLAAYAFTEGCEIGVDVEQWRPMPYLEQVARRFFAPEEVRDLLELPEAGRYQGFFNCWTRKEAYIKAIGEGLAAPLASFCVTLRPGVPARMLCLRGSVEAASNWSLHDFVPAPDSIGALAYQDQARPLAIRPLQSAEELLAGL